jgi:diguanylate cyclase (GGDEF)-like protein
MFVESKLIITFLGFCSLGLGLGLFSQRVTHRQERRKTRFYESVSASNQAVTSSKDKNELIARICTAGRDKTGYLRVSVIDRFGNVIFDTDGSKAITDSTIGLSLLNMFDSAQRHEPIILKQSSLEALFKKKNYPLALYPIFINQHVSMMMCVIARSNSYLDVEHIAVLDELIGDIEFGIKAIDEKSNNNDRTLSSDYQKYDALTGMLNKKHFMHKAELFLNTHANDDKLIAFCYISANELNSASDNVWVHNSDEIIKSLAHKIRGSMPYEAIAHRVGYSDFLIVMQVENRIPLRPLVNRMLEAITIHSQIDNIDVEIRPTIGISLYPDNGKTVGDLAVAAQRALFSVGHQAKRIIFSETNVESTFRNEKNQFESALKKTIGRGELELHYQPQVNLSTGATISYEALIRWNDPVSGLIYPDRFIGLAEHNGFIIEMGHWVIQEACRRISMLKKSGLSTVKIAVNLSPVQFHDDKLLDIVKAAIVDNNIASGELEFEITESAVMDNEVRAIKMLHDFKSIGILLSIDDFGVGHSSLAYLKRLPVDQVKIDRSFISELPHDNHNATIVKAILDIAACLNITVVAEGIETKEQEQFMLQLGCMQGQGMLYGMATRLKDIEV